MKVKKFEFDENSEESGKFDRVETKKGLMEVGVSPYAETKRLDAVKRERVVDDMRESNEG